MSCHRWSWAAALSAAVVVAGPFVLAAEQESPPEAAPKAAPEAAKKIRGQRAIEEALKQKVDAEFVQLPARQFADWLEERGGFEVEIDNRGLTDAGLDPEPMEIDFTAKQMSLGAVLHHALRPLDLTWVVSNDVLLITTADKAGEQLSGEMYPAADLVKFRGPDGKVSVNAEHLIELVTGTCAPVTWDSVGGAGSLKEYKGLLVVSQTRAVHAQVRGLLETLRAANSALAGGDRAPRRLHDGVSDDAAVLAALNTQTHWSLVQTPLGELVAAIGREKNVPVLIDQRGMADAGIDPGAVEVNAEISATKLSSALDRVFDQLDLAYVVDHEAIVITTKDRAASMFETHFYGVDDLVAADQPGDEPDSRAEELQQWLTGTVDPASWDAVGGSNNAVFVAPWKLLVVSAPASTQHKAADALDKLREAKRRQAEAGLEPSTALATEDPVELRVLAMSAASGEAETAEKVADLVRELVPEFAEQSIGDGSEAPYLRALPDRMVVRHRRSVLAKVEKLLGQLETPQGGAAMGAATFGR